MIIQIPTRKSDRGGIPWTLDGGDGTGNSKAKYIENGESLNLVADINEVVGFFIAVKLRVKDLWDWVAVLDKLSSTIKLSAKKDEGKSDEDKKELNKVRLHEEEGAWRDYLD